MPFKIPESYRAYCTDPAVRTAVDQSFQTLRRPDKFEWKDLRAFHWAHHVRCEYAVFLIELWDAVWQHALNECDSATDFEPRSVADAQQKWRQWHRLTFDTNTVWNRGWFGRVSDIVDTNFLLAPGVGDDGERVWLSLSLRGQDDANHTTGRSFGEDWPEEAIEEGCAWTSKQLAPIRDDGSIDLAPLCRAADDALATVRTDLPD